MAIGGIGSTSPMNSMSSMQTTRSSDVKDQKTKSLQNDITQVQQQMQKLSSDEDLSVTEKEAEKKKLEQEKSDLSAKLKLHQDELLKSQKREIKLAQLQEEREPEKEEASEDNVQTAETSSASDLTDKKNLPADERRSLQPGTIITQNSDGTVILKEVMNQTADRSADAKSSPTDEAKEKTGFESEKAAAKQTVQTNEDDTAADTGLTESEVQAMVSADSTMQQADRQGTLVNKTGNDIAVLKSEIKQDALRGVDTDKKEAELKELQKQQKREMEVQFSMLGEANRTAQTATETNASANSTQIDSERTFHVSGIGASQEDQALQQGFQVSIA